MVHLIIQSKSTTTIVLWVPYTLCIYYRVYLMGSSIWLTVLGLYPLAIPDISKTSFFPIYMVLLHYVLSFLTLIWKVIPVNHYCGGEKVPGQSGSVAAISIFNFYAGVGATLHSIFLGTLFLGSSMDYRSILAECWKILLQPNVNGAVYFMIIDTISFFAMILLFIAIEAGPVQAALALGKSVIFGPGSAFLFFASWREKRLIENGGKAKME